MEAFDLSLFSIPFLVPVFIFHLYHVFTYESTFFWLWKNDT